MFLVYERKTRGPGENSLGHEENIKERKTRPGGDPVAFLLRGDNRSTVLPVK